MKSIYIKPKITKKRRLFLKKHYVEVLLAQELLNLDLITTVTSPIRTGIMSSMEAKVLELTVQAQ